MSGERCNTARQHFCDHSYPYCAAVSWAQPQWHRLQAHSWHTDGGLMAQLLKRDFAVLLLSVCAVYLSLQHEGELSFRKAW